MSYSRAKDLNYNKQKYFSGAIQTPDILVNIELQSSALTLQIAHQVVSDMFVW